MINFVLILIVVDNGLVLTGMVAEKLSNKMS